MPYMMGGFPDRETSAAVADAYVEAGADLVELGIPYSDPLADGPVIHAAGTRALVAGATLDSVLTVCERIASRVPVVPMAYANMALARGGAVARMLADAGAAGAIVPDLPPEADRWPRRCGGPTARSRGRADDRAERRARLCAGAEGFVYVVSDTRTTGERLPAALGELVAAARADRLYRLRSGSGSGPPSWQRRWAESPTG